MGAKDDAAAWAQSVQQVANKRDLRYEPIGGINPKGGPVALCPGGTNRVTGELAPGFWGASCDADEHEEGGLFQKAVLPGAVLVKMHAPDVAKVMPPFNIESIEAHRPGELLEQRASRHKVEFESVEFNKRFLATVPKEYDPIALREMFSPGFLDWVTRIDREVDFGVSERQAYMLWRLRERTADEYATALDVAGGLFPRVRKEIAEENVVTYAAGPWDAGLEPYPAAPGR